MKFNEHGRQEGVILSPFASLRVNAAKDLTHRTPRYFAALRMTISIAAICFILASCTGNILPGISNSPQCQSNCGVGSGVQGVQVFVEPDDGEQVITNAIGSAQKSIWLEIYILSDRTVIRSLEEAANRGLDVRVMLEPHPFGGGTSPSKTLDTLAAAGIKTQFTNPGFSLTHEKCIPIVRNVSVQLYRTPQRCCLA